MEHGYPGPQLNNWDHTLVAATIESRVRSMVVDQLDPLDSKELVSPPQQFKIRVASTTSRREDANLLIDRMYAWRGYKAEAITTKQPNRIMIVAHLSEHTIGTITLCLDSEAGLPADLVFRKELDELRSQGRILAEPSRFAIDATVKSKKVLATLQHILYIYGRNIHGCTDFIIEVNPRHVLWYQKMLDFTVISEERNCPQVNAPGVLLRMDLEIMQKKIQQFGGKQAMSKTEKSFYPFFFSPKTEIDITARMREGPMT